METKKERLARLEEDANVETKKLINLVERAARLPEHSRKAFQKTFRGDVETHIDRINQIAEKIKKIEEE